MFGNPAFSLPGLHQARNGAGREGSPCCAETVSARALVGRARIDTGVNRENEYSTPTGDKTWGHTVLFNQRTSLKDSERKKPEA